MMSRQTSKYIPAGVLLAVAVLSADVLSAPEQGRLIIEEGFESGKLPFRASGNAPEVVQATDARAGKYVMKSELTRASKVRSFSFASATTRFTYITRCCRSTWPAFRRHMGSGLTG